MHTEEGCKAHLADNADALLAAPQRLVLVVPASAETLRTALLGVLDSACKAVGALIGLLAVAQAGSHTGMWRLGREICLIGSTLSGVCAAGCYVICVCLRLLEVDRGAETGCRPRRLAADRQATATWWGPPTPPPPISAEPSLGGCQNASHPPTWCHTSPAPGADQTLL